MPTPFDEAFARVKQLVTNFQTNESVYLSVAYQEQKARRDFNYMLSLCVELGTDN